MFLEAKMISKLFTTFFKGEGLFIKNNVKSTYKDLKLLSIRYLKYKGYFSIHAACTELLESKSISQFPKKLTWPKVNDIIRLQTRVCIKSLIINCRNFNNYHHQPNNHRFDQSRTCFFVTKIAIKGSVFNWVARNFQNTQESPRYLLKKV